MPLHEEPAIVRFQAVKEFSDSEDAVIDYQATDAEPGERKASAVALKKSQLAAYQALARAAGLKLGGVAPRALGALASLQRLANPAPEPGSAVAVLNVGGQGGEFAVARGLQLSFTRGGRRDRISVRHRSLSRGASQSRGVCRAVAAASAPRALRGRESQRTRRGRSSARHAGDSGVPIRSAFRSGCSGGECRPAQLPARSDSFSLSAAAANCRSIFSNRASQKPREILNKRMLAWVGGIAAAVMLLLFGAGWMRLSAKDREMKQLIEAKDGLDRDLTALDQDDRRYKAVKDWRDKEVVWLDELYDVTASVQNIDTMRVTHFSANPTSTSLAGGAAKANKYASRVEVKGVMSGDGKPLKATHERTRDRWLPPRRGAGGRTESIGRQSPAIPAAMEHEVRRRKAGGPGGEANDAALSAQASRRRRRRAARGTTAIRSAISAWGGPCHELPRQQIGLRAARIHRARGDWVFRIPVLSRADAQARSAHHRPEARCG